MLAMNCTSTPTVSHDLSSEMLEPDVLARKAKLAPEFFRLRHCALKSPGFREYWIDGRTSKPNSLAYSSPAFMGALG